MTVYVSVENLKRFLAGCKNLFALKTEVPTKISELPNDSGYVTQSEVQTMIDAITDADGKEY